MCFDSDNNPIFMLDLVEIELITTSSTKKNYINAAPESVQLWLKIGIFILHSLSTFCLTAHVYKFFQTKTKHNLASKNLTLYCFLMLLVYLWIPTEAPLLTHLKIPEELYCLITIHLLLMPVFIKIIIAIDICWCFREAALCVKPPLGPQNRKFTIFCIITVGIPVGILSTAYLLGGLDWVKNSYHATKTVIRIIRIITICGAFFYIRKASFNKKNFLKQFSLHIRLLALIGAVPCVLAVIQVIFHAKLYQASKSCPNEQFNIKYLVFTIVVQLRFLLDGFAIGICFTFKKWSFQSVDERLQFYENCSKKTTECFIKSNKEQNCCENIAIILTPENVNCKNIIETKV